MERDMLLIKDLLLICGHLMALIPFSPEDLYTCLNDMILGL